MCDANKDCPLPFDLKGCIDVMEDFSSGKRFFVRFLRLRIALN